MTKRTRKRKVPRTVKRVKSVEPVLWLNDPPHGEETALFQNNPLLTINLSPLRPGNFVLREHDGFRGDMPEEDAGLAAYFFVLESIGQGLKDKSAKGQKSKKGFGSEFEWEKMGSATVISHSRYKQKLWNDLRNARILNFMPEHHLLMETVADRWLYKQADVEFDPVAPGTSLSDIDRNYRTKGQKAETSRLLETTVALGKHHSLTTKLPFDSCWISYGSGVPLNDMRKLGKAGAHEFNPNTIHELKIWVLAHLVLRSGYVHEFLMVCSGQETGVFFSPRRVPRLELEANPGCAALCLHGTPPPSEDARAWTWTQPFDMLPFTLDGLLGTLEKYGTTVLNAAQHGKLRSKRTWDNSAKAWGHRSRKLPPPFYVIELKPQLITERAEKGFEVPKSKSLTYQHDRWGHERVVIDRGPLPIDNKKLEALKKRAKRNKGDTRIFIEGDVDNETKERLIDRGVPLKRADEWMVVTATFIEDMLVPANPGPGIKYIPARRKVPRVKGEGSARLKNREGPPQA